MPTHRKPPIEAIPIDPAGRYVILMRGGDDIGAAARTAEHLKAWWESGLPFTLLSLPDGIEVEFKKVTADSEG